MHKQIYILLISLLCGCSTGYQIKDGKVVYKTVDEGNGTIFHPVSADPKSFEVLGDNNTSWARDGKHIFYKRHQVAGANPDTFIVLSDDYGKNAQYVIAGCDIVSGADVKSFQVLAKISGNNDLTHYAKDKNKAYWLDGLSGYSGCLGTVKAFEYGDYQSFEAVASYYSRDKKYVYYYYTRLKNANPSTLIFLNKNYVTDGKHVYYDGKLMIDADEKTFKARTSNSGKDKNFDFIGEHTFNKFCEIYSFSSRCRDPK